MPRQEVGNNPGVSIDQKTGLLTINSPISAPIGDSYTVTVTATNSAGSCASEPFTFKLNLPQKKPLNDMSWADIQTVIWAGKASEYWSVGDTKDVTLNGTVGLYTFNNETYKCFIIGIDHNENIEGKGVHFQFGRSADGKDLAFVDESYGTTGDTPGFRMNLSATNSGGWNNSYMRKTICPAFFNALPADLRNAIKECTKYTDNTGGGNDTASYVTATSDKIWLLAEFEIFGTRTYANSAEKNYQAQYAYYSSGNSKVKVQHNATGSPAFWWERSPYYGSKLSFCRVRDVGTTNYSPGGNSWGFAPAFKIG